MKGFILIPVLILIALVSIQVAWLAKIVISTQKSHQHYVYWLQAENAAWSGIALIKANPFSTSVLAIQPQTKNQTLAYLAASPAIPLTAFSSIRILRTPTLFFSLGEVRHGSQYLARCLFQVPYQVSSANIVIFGKIKKI